MKTKFWIPALALPIFLVACEQAAKTTEEKLEVAKEAATEKMNAGADKVAEGMKEMKDAAGDKMDAAKEQAKAAMEKATEKTKDAVEVAKGVDSFGALMLGSSSMVVMGSLTYWNVALFERLHWRALEAMALRGRPHMRMEADLAHYPPCTAVELGFLTTLRSAA